MYDDPMDLEGFYDSLEEEFSSASSSSIPSEKPQQNCETWNIEKFNDVSVNGDFPPVSKLPILIIKPPNSNSIKSKISTTGLVSEFKNKCCTKSETNIDTVSDISFIIPLYDGDIPKSVIRKSCNIPSSPELNGKDTSSDEKSTDKNHSYQKKRSKMTNIYYKQSKSIDNEKMFPKGCSKSYLDIFRARTGCPETNKKNKPEDTVRSIFGDSKRSDITGVSINENEEFIDAEDSKSDTTSFYFNIIEECNKSITDDKCNSCEVISRPTMSSISRLELDGASEIFSNHNSSVKSKTFLKKSKLFPVPVLGGLGPDPANQEKLEQRNKQLKYGQRASYRNRIKLMEMHVLKNLKEEIKESNSLDKKNRKQPPLH